MTKTVTISPDKIQIEPPRTASLKAVRLPEIIEIDECLKPIAISDNHFVRIAAVNIFEYRKLSLHGHIQITSNQLELFSPVKVFGLERLIIPSSIPILSSDLFETLDRVSVRIFGMSYADKYWREFPSPKASDGSNARSKRGADQSRRDNAAIKRTRRRKDGKTVPEPPLWDLIFVVLQPPLQLNTSENVFLPHKLYGYQVTGIEFLLSHDGALLADDMGTGKTVMTIVALRILFQKGKASRALIVCPPSVLYEWQRHLEEWAPELVSIFVRGTGTQRSLDWRSEAHIYVTTYDTVRRDVDSRNLPVERLGIFDTVIIDEAHHAKNASSARSRALRKMRAKRRWALTGTPLQNSIDDVRAIFTFLHPGLLTTAVPDHLVSELIKPYFLRRLKKDVMKDLPPKQIQEFWLELDEEQRKVYQQVEAGIRSELAALGDAVTKRDIFRNLTRLKQICNFAPGRGTSPKVALLKDQVEDIIRSGNKVIIFSQFLHEGIEKLEYALSPYKFAKIVGGQPDSVRRHEIERFKRLDDVNVLLASVKAGGEGLNLVEATYVIHFDHWWNPAVMRQAEDRVHRRGQAFSVNVYSYWMQDTVEERIYDILKQKHLLVENVIDNLSEAEIDHAISTEEWLQAILMDSPKPKTAPSPVRSSRNETITEITARLLSISPSEFEKLTARLLQHLGIENVRVVGQSHDGGVDVTGIRNTRNGIVRVAVQCKRYSGIVGIEVARGFVGALQAKPEKYEGFLITTGKFSQDCLQYCELQNIKVISGLDVARYIQKYGIEF